MLCKDLIKILEKMIEDNKPHEHMMGEAEIMIDVFSKIGNTHTFEYRGFDHNIRITPSSDGVYQILTAFVEGTK